MEKLRLEREGFVESPGWSAPSGVYCLLVGGTVVYVGQARKVYQRLTAHYNTKMRPRRGRDEFLSEGDIRARPIPFDSVMIRFCAVRDLDRIEIEYIERYRPKYNIANRDIGQKRIRVDVTSMAQRLGINWKPPADLGRRRVA